MKERSSLGRKEIQKNETTTYRGKDESRERSERRNSSRTRTYYQWTRKALRGWMKKSRNKKRKGKHFKVKSIFILGVLRTGEYGISWLLLREARSERTELESKKERRYSTDKERSEGTRRKKYRRGARLCLEVRRKSTDKVQSEGTLRFRYRFRAKPLDWG